MNAARAACETGLPVTLVEFAAKAENGMTQLFWVTSGEHNSDRFEIEHSNDGKIWKSLGKVMAHGETYSPQSYLFQHTNPQTGNNYYRLRMVDLDGTYAFSKINHMYFHQLQAQVYPNPVTNILKIQVPIWNDVKTVELFNTSGKLFYKTSGIPVNSIDVEKYPRGNYFLKFVNKDRSVASQKVVLL